MKRGIAPAVVDAVLERAQYSCEICSSGVGHVRGLDWSLHHRRPRGMGGSRRLGVDLPSNLLLLCGSGTTGCHGFIESNRTAALAGGWLVGSRQDPREEPVFIARARWVYLSHEATYIARLDGAR